MKRATCVVILLLLTALLAGPALAQDVKSILKLDQAWSGDFDGMVERHLIRALVPYSKTFYFLDGADPVSYTHLTLPTS